MPKEEFLPLTGSFDHILSEPLPESPATTIEQARRAMQRLHFLGAPADHSALEDLAEAMLQMARVGSCDSECRADDLDDLGWMKARVEEL